MSGERPKRIPLKTCPQPSDEHRELKLGKRGIYLIEGCGKLKTFRLVSWDDFLGTLRGR